MTATVAARAAVEPRPVRGAAGRRAVQTVLFLGGLLALGLLAGGRAEAQERPEPGPLTASVADVVPERAAPGSAVRKTVERSAQRVVEPVDRDTPQRATQQRSIREPVAGSAAEPTAEPAADPEAPAPVRVPVPAAAVGSTPDRVRDPVTVGVGDAVDRVAGEARPVASLPGLPPLFPLLPVPGGEPNAPGAPSPSGPGNGRGAEDGSGALGPDAAGADTSVERAAGYDRGAGALGSTPAVPDGSAAPDVGHARVSAPAGAPGRAPFAPSGDLVRTAVADVQGPRGGDLHALPVPGGPSAALVRGAGLPATTAPIPDRSGEILEFPG